MLRVTFCVRYKKKRHSRLCFQKTSSYVHTSQKKPSRFFGPTTWAIITRLTLSSLEGLTSNYLLVVSELFRYLKRPSHSLQTAEVGVLEGVGHFWPNFFVEKDSYVYSLINTLRTNSLLMTIRASDSCLMRDYARANTILVLLLF